MNKENKQGTQHASAPLPFIKRSEVKPPNDVKIGGQNADRSPPHPSVELPSPIKHKINVKNPCVYVMDCGSWVYGKHQFGLLCGSYAYIAKLNYDHNEQCAIVKTSNQLVNQFFSGLIHAEIIDHIIADPIGNEDPESVFCEPDRLYIFIPDIHAALGSQDPCDGAYGVYRENIVRLSEFLSYCKQVGAVIIQTGDMIDFWTVEASLDVFYTNGQQLLDRKNSLLRPLDPIDIMLKPLDPTGIMLKRLDPIGEIAKANLVLRPRSDRLKLASDLITKELHDNIWKSVLSKIDCYIVGNHDWEIDFSECIGLKLFIESQGVTIFHSITPVRMIGTNVYVTHGHLIKNTSNDTSDANDVDSAMNVTGKPITFSYARYKRNKAILFSFAPLDPAEHMDFWDRASKIATESVAGRHFDNWMDWMADWKEFSLVRAGMLDDMLHTLRRDNSSGYQFKLDKADVDAIFDKRKDFFDNERLITWDCSEKPLKPPKISKRIIIHSHTHTPQISRIKIIYEPSAENSQATKTTEICKNKQQDNCALSTIDTLDTLNKTFGDH